MRLGGEVRRMHSILRASFNPRATRYQPKSASRGAKPPFIDDEHRWPTRNHSDFAAVKTIGKNVRPPRSPDSNHRLSKDAELTVLPWRFSFSIEQPIIGTTEAITAAGRLQTWTEGARRGPVCRCLGSIGAEAMSFTPTKCWPGLPGVIFDPLAGHNRADPSAAQRVRDVIDFR